MTERDFSIFEKTQEEIDLENQILGKSNEEKAKELKGHFDIHLTGRYSGDSPIILDTDNGKEEFHQTTLEVLLTDDQFIELMNLKKEGGTFSFVFVKS